MPVAELPNVVPMRSFPITGGVVQHSGLKYRLSFGSSDPLLTSLSLLQVPVSCARSSLIPKTFAEFVSAIVRALPDWMVRIASKAHPPKIGRAGPSGGLGIDQVVLKTNRCVRSKL